MNHSRPDRRRLAAAARTLASPLAHRTRELWYRDVMARMRELCGGDGAIIATPDERSTRYFTDDLPEFAAQCTAWIRHCSGLMTSPDAAIDRGFEVIRHQAAVGYTSAAIDRAIGNRLRGSAFWNEVCAPTGGKCTSGLAVRTSRGEVNLVVVHHRDAFEPFGEETTGILMLLAPAFAAGLEALERLDASTAALTAVLDRMPAGMLVRDLRSGGELYRNQALSRLLDEDPERERLARVLSGLARAMCDLHRERSAVQPSPSPIRELVTERASYRAWATFLPPAIFARDAAVLVSLQRLTPELPSAATLTARFGLTAREAQVALRLARGASEVALASELGISAHTARHHTERIFDKLGVRTRKALALHLLGGETPVGHA